MVNPKDLKDPNWRAKYRNPSPPPGYVKKKMRLIRKKSEFEIFLEENEMDIFSSGVRNDPNPEEFVFPPNEQMEDDEVVPLPMKRKIPEVIDLESDSDPPIPSVVVCRHSPVLPPSPEKPIGKKLKSMSKHNNQFRKEKIVEYESSDGSTYSLSHCHLKKKRKRNGKDKFSIACSPKKRRYSGSIHSRSRSPRREKHTRSRSPRQEKRAKSRSPRQEKRTRSKSPRQDKRTRSKSPRQDKRTRSKSPRQDKRTRSRSPRRERRTRSISPRREVCIRSRSPRQEKCIRSMSPKQEKISSKSPQRERWSKSPSHAQSRHEVVFEKFSESQCEDRSECEVIYENKYTINNFEDKYIKMEFIKQENIGNQELIDGNNNIHGSYYCQACKASMTSELTYHTHIQGKRHQKAMKARNPVAIVDECLLNHPEKSKYPPVAADKYRVRLNQPAKIQYAVEASLKVPSPGLHNLYEIQSVDDTVEYYCALCDSNFQASSLIPHLEGFKHLLNCLKLYDTKTYERYQLKKKGEIWNSLIRILKGIEKENGGLGCIAVEKDYMNDSDPGLYNTILLRERSFRRDVPGPSSRSTDDFTTKYNISIKPDTSKSDYYCQLCDSHMNSTQMWEAHVTGTRHLKNLKKAPGEGPSKVKSYRIKDARAKLMDEIDQLREPVIGLDVIRETQNPVNGGVQYNCYLCGGCMTQLDVVDHVLSVKHKTKYLESIKNPDYMIVKDMGINERHLISVIEEAVYNVFQENGPGQVEVYITKNAVAKW